MTTTDITLEASPEPRRIDFADFVRAQIPELARALSLIVDSDVEAATWLDRTVTAARREWSTIGFDDQPSRYVFATAVALVAANRSHSDADVAEVKASTYLPACAVARAGLLWPIEDIVEALDTPHHLVVSHLESARNTFLIDAGEATDGTASALRKRVLSAMAKANVSLPDGAEIDRNYRRAHRRGRAIRSCIALGTTVLALALLGSFVSRSDRTTQSSSAAANAPASSPALQSPDVLAAPPEPTSMQVVPLLTTPPDVIAADGNGGFIGVTSSIQAGQATFSRSPDGQTWVSSSTWDLSPGSEVARLERSGENFVAWIGKEADRTDVVIATIGVSSDLVTWSVIELPINDAAPTGLIYDQVVADVSVSSTNVLALVTTNVEIDFAALSLSEGYTCGRTINRDEVVVNLCNDAELDVLSLSTVTELPERNRLFVSRDGEPFSQTKVPFSSEIAVTLTHVAGAFAITDQAGWRFATSTDATVWRATVAGKPPLRVRAADTDADNVVVGVGNQSGQVVLFRNVPGNFVATPVEEVVGSVSDEVQALVGRGPTRWVVYLYDPTAAWMLASDDGVVWSAVATSAPSANKPRLLVGDNEALIQWIDIHDNIFTLGVPLPDGEASG